MLTSISEWVGGGACAAWLQHHTVAAATEHSLISLLTFLGNYDDEVLVYWIEATQSRWESNTRSGSDQISTFQSEIMQGAW